MSDGRDDGTAHEHRKRRCLACGHRGGFEGERCPECGSGALTTVTER